MDMMLACASHSPLLHFPGEETDGVQAIRAALAETQRRVVEFDPELIVLFGCDHYGGHQMVSMPSFCIGVEATAMEDVGGTPGRLDVPRAIAVAAVNALRNDDVDVAVSYAMDVDHGFSQVLQDLAGGVSAFPVLPVFVSCLQPPFTPFKRGRALGAAMARFIAGLDVGRVLVLGTGGLSHNPEHLFPAIDDVSEAWRPYHLHGRRQSDVTQQQWIDYEFEAHRQGARMIVEQDLPLSHMKISEDWDRRFLARLCEGDLREFDRTEPKDVIREGGFGAMETLSWVAATQCYADATGARPHPTFHRGVREVAVGFGIAEGPSQPVRAAEPAASGPVAAAA